LATILLVEDEPDLGLCEAEALVARGHSVRRCSGGPSLFSACPMMREGYCSLVENVDLILFSCRMFAPIRGRTYRGSHLLRAYRSHPVYGRLPMIVVSVGVPGHLEGSGPLDVVEKYAAPHVVIDAVERMLSRAGGRPAGAEVAPAASAPSRPR
jgi:CheY-like chemotaxis protein